MPRVTRAALRSQEEDPASVPLPLTPIKGRAPLGEASGNTLAEPQTLNNPEDTMAAGKKGKKGKATKKTTEQSKVKEPAVEVMEDDNQSQTSSAAEEACKDLLKETPGILYSVPSHSSAELTLYFK